MANLMRDVPQLSEAEKENCKIVLWGEGLDGLSQERDDQVLMLTCRRKLINALPSAARKIPRKAEEFRALLRKLRR